jgi:DNA primase
VVEGNFDVIALHQAGFDETVAPLGTALTDRQVDTLRHLASRVVLCLDGDRAGRTAAIKDIALLVAAGVESRVVELPEGDDPDSFVRKHGAEALEGKIAHAPPGVDYFLHEIFGRSDRSVERRTLAVKEAAQLLAQVADEVRRDILIDQFAKGLDVEPRVLRKAMGDGRSSPSGVMTPPVTVPKRHLPPAKELKLLQILADHPELHPLADQLGVRSLLTDARLRDMYSASQAGRSVPEYVPAELMDVVAGKSGEFKNLEDPARTLTETVRSVQGDHLVSEINDIKRRQQDAVREGNHSLARELAMRLLETQSKADALRRRPEEGSR